MRLPIPLLIANIFLSLVLYWSVLLIVFCVVVILVYCVDLLGD